MALEWKHPFTCIVSGPTGSGKTTFVKELLKNSHMIKPSPKRVVWCYGVYQDLFKSLPGVEFNEGLPDQTHLTDRTLLIIDDLMFQQDEKITEIFTKNSHHKGVSVIFLTQNFFHKGAREMTLNAQYIVLMKNPRDTSQIHFLARQMFPAKSKFMIEAYNDATRAPFGYLFLDLRQETDEKHRVRTGVFPGQTNYAYLPK